MHLLVYLLALLLAWLTPTPGDVLSRMASPRFAERERATTELASRLTYALAVKLSVSPPADPEARSRVSRVLVAYWSVSMDYWPYIDALNQTRLCGGPNAPLVQRYLEMARSRDLRSPGRVGEYRAATSLLVTDLQRWFVPPKLIRLLLAEMAWRSELYDALGQCGVPMTEVARYRRMPGSPSTWLLTTVYRPDGTCRQELRPK